jgi:hypothetical protein
LTAAKVLFSLALVPAIFAQERITDENFNGWYMYFGSHALSKRTAIHFDGQWRRTNGITRYQQYLLRPGLTYDLTKHWQVGGGYAFIKTYPYGDFPLRQAVPEQRLWQQVITKWKTGRVDWTVRNRFEERWIGVFRSQAVGPLSIDHYRYEHRWRGMVRTNIALRGKWMLALYNELLIHVPPEVPARTYDHNRAYAALGYKFRPTLRVEFGYMNQYLAQRNGRIFENNHTIQLGFYSTTPFRK